VQITLQGLRRDRHRRDRADEPFPVAVVHPAKDLAADGDEVTDSSALASAAETAREMVDRIPTKSRRSLKMNVSDPGGSPISRHEHEIPDLRQGRSAAAARRRPTAAFLLSRLEQSRRAQPRDGGREEPDEIKIEQHQREF